MVTDQSVADTERASFQPVHPCAFVKTTGRAHHAIRVRRRPTPKQIQKVIIIVSIIVNLAKHAMAVLVLPMVRAHATRILPVQIAHRVRLAFFLSVVTTSARCSVLTLATSQHASLDHVMNTGRVFAMKVHPATTARSTALRQSLARFAAGTVSACMTKRCHHTRIRLASKRANAMRPTMAIHAITNPRCSMTLRVRTMARSALRQTM